MTKKTRHQRYCTNCGKPLTGYCKTIVRHDILTNHHEHYLTELHVEIANGEWVGGECPMREAKRIPWEDQYGAQIIDLEPDHDEEVMDMAEYLACHNPDCELHDCNVYK